jgi:hypothetical protein
MPAAGGVRHLDRLLVQLAKLDLDAPRTTAMVSGPGDERSATVVIHPGRIDPSVGGPAAGTRACCMSSASRTPT